MKRILAIITALTISWTTFFISGSEVFASGQLVETKPAPTINGVKGLLVADLIGGIWDTLQDVPEDFHKLCDAYRQAMAKSSCGNYFNGITDASLAQYSYFFDTDSLGEFAGHQLIGYCLSAGASVYVGYENATGQIELVEYDTESGSDSGSGGGFRPAKPEVSIPSEIFTDVINNNTTVLTTSLPTTLVSWKHNPLAVSGYDKVRTVNHFAVMVAGKWFGQSKDLYAMPYVNMNGITYYGDSVYHFHYGDFEYNYYVSSAAGVTGSKTVTDYPVIDKYSSLSISAEISDTLYPMVSTDSIYEKSWDNVYIVPNGVDSGIGSVCAGDKEFYISGLQSSYQTLYNYFKNTDSNSFGGSSLPLFNDFYNASNSGDKSSFSSFPNFSNGMTAFGSSYATIVNDNWTLSVDDVPYDYGFLVCSKRFEIGTLNSYLDGSRIPDNSYVTISGDSIYDYSITNGDTGDTTNIGDFINNGYAWLNTGSGNQTNTGGNGGGTGGNVTVGGDVNVSGSIDVGGSVDINVNVNGGGNVNSYDFGEDDLTSNIPETPSNFIEFLKIQMSWLPAPVLSLLMGGLSVVIIIAIFGIRRH